MTRVAQNRIVLQHERGRRRRRVRRWVLRGIKQ